MTENEFFAKGDKVIWRSTYNLTDEQASFVRAFRSELGEGPFTVICVMPVDDEKVARHRQALMLGDTNIGDERMSPISGFYFTKDKR